MSTTRAVWLARENRKRGAYLMFARKPRRKGINFRGPGYLDVWCDGLFERVTGFRLQPGDCVRVTIQVRRVGR